MSMRLRLMLEKVREEQIRKKFERVLSRWCLRPPPCRSREASPESSFPHGEIDLIFEGEEKGVLVCDGT